MRIIKFRIWETLNNKMTKWEDIRKYDLFIVNWPNECHPDNRDEFKVMQFTGLKDKNGKEMFEGDVVENESGQRFIQELCCLGDEIKRPNKPRPTRDEELWYKVIGNIYENPELIP